MAMKLSTLSLLLGFILVSNILLIKKTTCQQERKVYIVYMGKVRESHTMGTAVHLSMLQKVSGSGFAPNLLLRSFGRSFNGFVAMLTEKEAKIMSGLDDVVSVFPSKTQQLHTTRSWDFMGFSKYVNRNKTESDIIVGVIDSGIWPESESFNDTGFGPPPSKWKGTCQVSKDFPACNNKIIGARYYRANNNISGIKSPRDTFGHGTHVASTVAGNLVNGASFYGLASGTARGGVPSARIAVYKVCWSIDGCEDADVKAAFDDAIADGVDIISISIGSKISRDYFEDPIAIGSFHAMEKGILTSISAGNEGPNPASITNVATWTLSVAASTIDRKFITNVKLGDGRIYQGVSLNTIPMENFNPLIDARECGNNASDPSFVKDKIVLYSAPIISCVGTIGGAIFADNSPKDSAEDFSFEAFPASHISKAYGASIFRYIITTSNSSAYIYMSNEAKDEVAPYVASISSRGPNPISPDILKPDLSAPGVSILAAWPMIAPTSVFDKRHVPYNIISGTSMACPHASAAAVYVKSFNPTWSPAAIKSALMTTARPMNIGLNIDANFAFGAGHLDPIKALTPGLIYDADVTDYVRFLCGQGYGPTIDVDCSKIYGSVWDLNYPSFALSAIPTKTIYQNFTRVVTNVGSPSSSYNSTLSHVPYGLIIQVIPNVLAFTSLGQKLPFNLTIQGRIRARSTIFASLTWDDGQHQVRSPIVVYDITLI